MPVRPFVLDLTVALLTASALAAPVKAADLDPALDLPPVPVAESKVEFGTGWYIRGDIGATRLPQIDLSSTTDTQAPILKLTNGSKLGYDGSLAVGYAYNSSIRFEAMADFHQPFSYKQYGNFYGASSSTCQAAMITNTSTGVVTRSYVDCSSNYTAKVTSYDVMANAYYDIGTWYGITPYVGAGVGLSFGHYNSTTAYTQDDGSSYNTYFTDSGTNVTYHGYRNVAVSGNYYNFAFAAMAGFAYDLTHNTKVDIGYRYLHLGPVLGTTITTQEVRAGLRYMIDN